MPLRNGNGGFPSCSAADRCAHTMSLYIGALRRLIGTRAPIYRRVACNELSVIGTKHLSFFADN